MTTTITCIKSEFRANLRNHYATGVVIDKAQADELDEVIDGLVRQANEHRGTFEGYSAYLDCDFTVMPDNQTPDADNCPNGAGCEDHPRGHYRKQITIPAVTDAQRAQSADAAEITLRRIGSALRTVAGALGVYATDPEMLDAYAADLHAWADRLRAAAGHLRIANGQS